MRKKRNSGTVLAVVLTALIVIAFYALSWIATCGLIKLLTMCFGLTFKWGWATGIWIILAILQAIFSKNK